MPRSHEKEVHRETGEPPGSAPPGPDAGIAARITALDALATADLRIEWRRLYRATPPTRLSRDLLLRGVAYKLQEQAHRGLSPGIQRRLRSLVEGPDKQSRLRAAPAITLKPGTKLDTSKNLAVMAVS
jgi:hypothetical protein